MGRDEKMSDLIDRQAAIDAILRITNCKSVRELFEYNQEHHLTEMWSGGVNDAIDAVIGVESATDNNVSTKLSTDLASLGTDCISRQQAIDALRDYLAEKRCPDDGTLTCRLIENEVINKLPPIQPNLLQPWEVLVAQAVLPHPEPHWIPVTERLPEVNGCYLVSVKNDHERRYSKTAWFEKDAWFARQDVLAWQPLPEPYKGVTE